MLNETVKHYNMEVDFFKEFLDPYMKYTSGLFESESENLEVATRRMLDTIIELAGLEPGAAVLEVGPGWGAFLKRVTERNLDVLYTGVSPSEVQNSYIRTFKKDAHQVVTSTFESLEYSGPALDAIVLIGSFCHLSDKQRQLARMRDMLADDGCIIIEDTFFISEDDYARHADNSATRYVQEKIFGFAEILSLQEQLEQIQAEGLQVVSMLEHSDSYKNTIRHWIKNLKKLDPASYPRSRDFIKYMTIAQRGWNHTTHNQLLCIKKAP